MAGVVPGMRSEALVGLSGFEAWWLSDTGSSVPPPGLAHTVSALLAAAHCPDCPGAELWQRTSVLRGRPLTWAWLWPAEPAACRVTT